MPAGMKRGLALALLVLVGGLVLALSMGGLAALEAQAVAAQRSFRDSLATALRALRANESGALWPLVVLSFGYGVLHAAGPGHGKVLIGSYALARRLPLWRTVGLAGVSALVQALVAVVLVYGGLGLFGLTRDAVGATGEGWMTSAGYVLTAALGAWLIWRGLRHLRQSHATVGLSGHAHDHGHTHAGQGGAQAPCQSCGHHHGPTPAQIAAVTSWREMALLVGGVALRPCTGALMLLVLTWQLGLVWSGIAGVLAMATGTALVTSGVAALAVGTRESALAGLPGLAALRATMPVAEVLAGALILILALAFLLP